MGRRFTGERYLGPYAHPCGHVAERCSCLRVAGYRNIHVVGPGKAGRVALTLYPTADEAREERRRFEADITALSLTTETTLVEYEVFLTTIGHTERGPCSEKSARATCAIVGRFFKVPRPIHGITARLIAELYKKLSTENSEATGKPLKADSHRNILLQVRSYLKWCVGEGYFRKNPADGIKGTGRRSKGKQKLSIKETRAWLPIALELAESGDVGAVAALMALLMGLRASEIVNRLVSDVDELEEPGDTLNVPYGKNDAARRLLEVPAELRPFLAALAEGKSSGAWLFPTRKSASGKHDYGWVEDQVKRICDLAKVTLVGAHAMRGKFAEIASRVRSPDVGRYGGWSDDRTRVENYAGRDAVEAGEREEALRLIQGGKK